MGITTAIPEPVQVVLVGENQAVVVQPPSKVLPIVVEPDGTAVVLSPTQQIVPVVVEFGGPQGPSGEGADLHYRYTQGTPSAKWTILHNLGKFPSVIVQDSANDEVEGDINYISINELVITFSAPFAGVAYLN